MNRPTLATALAAISGVLLAACGGGDGGDAGEAAGSAFFSELPGASAPSQPAADATPVEPVDYAGDEAWLCLPGRADICEADASVTRVAADGSLEVAPHEVDPEAPIDCFYVYPTVSDDAAANSDIVPGPGEENAALNQAAYLSSVCRVYAPMYRQVTLVALRAMLSGGESMTDREMAYADVRAAWRHYLETHNQGRGVVLIGHSQGAGILSRLIASEIDGPGTSEQIVSAVLAGINVEHDPARPSGAVLGGLPLCAEDTPYGCLIAYASYRDDRPAGPDALFGEATQRGREVACVNPAELDGSQGALSALLPVGQAFESSEAPPPWSKADVEIETPLVALPGMLTAQCRRTGGRSFLSVRVAGDPADMRADDIVGDVVVDGEAQPGWGLHILDINLALGNLASVIAAQGEAWRIAHGQLVPPDSASNDPPVPAETTPTEP